MGAPEPIWIVPLRQALEGRRVGGELRWYEALPSTSDVAREWLDRGGPDGLVVLAGRQTAGRGRRGRSWSSPAGRGLYLSVGLRPDLDGALAARLMLLGAVAVAEALRETGVTAEIRWPNDVDVGGKKIAGILVESRVDARRVTTCALGIGVNLRHGSRDLPPETESRATSVLLERGSSPSELAVTGALLERLDHWYGRLAPEGGADGLLERWRELAPGHRGTRVVVEEGEGRFAGVTCGMEPDGALRVRPEDGPVRIVRMGELLRIRPGTCPPEP